MKNLFGEGVPKWGVPILIIIFFISGCATAPRKEAIFFRGATYFINGTSYVPASAVIQRYSANHTWDPIARKLIIEKNGKEAIFCVGADAALINNNIKRMPAAVKMDSGKIMIPASFASSVLKELFLPSIISVRRKRPIPYKGKYTIRTIVIDPGHGGRDPGAISATGIREKDIALSISKRLKGYLQKEGIKTILTRDSDRFISLWRRSHIANENNADFFISIHANAARTKYANGVEVFYLSEAVDDFARATAAAENAALQYESSSFNKFKPKSAVAATLGDMLSDENRRESIELAKCIGQGMSKSLSLRDRGVKGARFYVLKDAQMPSVLVEVGFLSNRKEAMKLKDKNFQQRLAKAIADGIVLYKHRYEKTDGFTRPR